MLRNVNLRNPGVTIVMVSEVAEFPNWLIAAIMISYSEHGWRSKSKTWNICFEFEPPYILLTLSSLPSTLASLIEFRFVSEYVIWYSRTYFCSDHLIKHEVAATSVVILVGASTKKLFKKCSPLDGRMDELSIVVYKHVSIILPALLCSITPPCGK